MDKPMFRFGVDYGVYERALFFLVAADSLEKRGIVVGCVLDGVVDSSDLSEMMNNVIFW